MPVILKRQFLHRVASAEAEVHARLTTGRSESFIYVAPTKRKVRALQREFLQHVPRQVAPGFFLFTLETLAAAVHGLALPPKRFITGPAQAVLVHEAMCSVEARLRYFRPGGGIRKLPKGTLQQVIDVLNHLKERGVYHSTLLAELDSAGDDEKARLEDIVTIVEAYEKLLGDRFIDPGGYFKEINHVWEPEKHGPVFRRHFPAVDLLVVAGFDEFSDPEMTLLYNLSHVDGIGTLISFDYHLENDEVFGHLKENYLRFVEMGFVKETVRRRTTSTFRDHFARYAFQSDSLAKRYEASDAVSLIEAADRLAEVDVIAKTIKQLAIDRPGRDLSKICVATYTPHLYTQLFREAFNRYGIPANITDRFHLDQSPLIVALLAFVSIRHRGYRPADIMRALSSPYFYVGDGGIAIDAGNLYGVAASLKISSGLPTWMRRIDQRLNRIAIELDRDDADRENDLAREREGLQKAQRDLSVLEEYLSPFSKQLTPGEFKASLTSLLTKLQVLPRMVDVPEGIFTAEQIEQDTRAYQKFMAFLDEFLEMLAIRESQDHRSPIGFYLEQIRAVIGQVRYNVRQRYGQGVLVTSLDETRGLSFEVMFIAGMVDGEFPPTCKSELFLSSARRARRERYHLQEHRYLFYQALTNFSERLIVTYPGSEGDRNLVPSSFLDALLKTVEMKTLKSDDTSFVSPIFSEDELLRRVGETLGRTSESYDESLKARLTALRADLRFTFDHIRNAIAVEQLRAGTLSSEYTGHILGKCSPDARAALERFRTRIYSITQLESYGSCPYQFFAERVLRLHAPPEIEAGVSPLERGTMLHDILFDFYTGRRDRGLPPLSSLDDAEFEAAVRELREIARRILDESEFHDVFWDIEKETILGSPNRPGILQQLLSHERSQQLDVQPQFFEVAFGPSPGARRRMDSLLRNDDPIRAGNVRLRGKVDRVDTGSSHFRIIDYKTGNTIAGRKEIDLGMSLQLPIYLYAIEQLLARHDAGGQSGVAGIYYKMQSPVQEKLGLGSDEHRDRAFVARKQAQLVADDAELRAVIEQAIRTVNEYVDAIANGNFPIRPAIPEKVCRYCTFRSICRIEAMVPASEEET